LEHTKDLVGSTKNVQPSDTGYAKHLVGCCGQPNTVANTLVGTTNVICLHTFGRNNQIFGMFQLLPNYLVVPTKYMMASTKHF